MIVIPIKTNKEDPAVNTVFGKSKWFAFINKNEITIEKNEFEGGQELVKALVKKGVKTIICNHMGQKPYQFVKQNGVECFYSGDERLTLSQAINMLEDNQLIKIDDSNESIYIKQGQGHHHH